MDIAAASVRVPISRAAARRVVELVLRAERQRRALLSVTFVSNRHIASLNRRHLRHQGPTDVISFAFAGDTRRTRGVIGDIYIAPEVARRNARARGIPGSAEVVRLLTHGTLHVLGYEHPETDDPADREASRMWRRQEALVKRARRVVSAPRRTRSR